MKDAKARDAFDVELDAAFAEHVGDAVDRVLQITPGTRYGRPEAALLAAYEKKFDSKIAAPWTGSSSARASPPSACAWTCCSGSSRRCAPRSARQLTAKQRDDAMRILNEARDVADGQEVAAEQPRRNCGRIPSSRLSKTRCAPSGRPRPQDGAIRVKVQRPTWTFDYESLNIEHKARKSDNPWRYNDPANLTASDAPLNQAYLETLRKHGHIWPQGAASTTSSCGTGSIAGVDPAPRR